MEGIPNQIRMGIGSITFHTRGSMRGHYVFFMPKSWTFYTYTLSKYYFQRLRHLFPWNEYAYYFGRYPDSIKNGDGLLYISWYGAQEGSICPPYDKIQNYEHARWTSAWLSVPDHCLSFYFGNSWPLGFPLLLFYFMPSLFFVFLFCMVSGEGSGIQLYRFLTNAFSSFYPPLITVLGFSASYFLETVMPVR